MEDDGGDGESPERHDYHPQLRRDHVLPGGEPAPKISARGGETTQRVAGDGSLLSSCKSVIII